MTEGSLHTTEEEVKKFFSAALITIVGCGSSGSLVQVRGGVEVSRTDWSIGYRDSTSHDSSVGRYEQCLAELGGLPDKEKVCQTRVLEELRLEQERLECASGCYYPSGFRRYGK